MKKILRIRRQESGSSEAYWEDHLFETDHESATAAFALGRLSEKTRCAGESSAVRERPWRPIAWEHSCLQIKCGACAMRIDGRPRLACDAILSGYREETITIEPLKKFPVVEDLIVDRASMMERLKALSVWFEQDAKDTGEAMAFEASKCLQCGLCLEVCPNFYTEGSFGGMAAMAPLSRLLSRIPEEQKKSAAVSYRKAVYHGCGKSLACRDICPAKVDLESLLVKSNAAAVWGRWGSSE